MGRFNLIIGLLVSFTLFSGAGIITWLAGNKTPQHTSSRKRKPISLDKLALRFYPSVPTSLPDLNDGYIFSQSRVGVANDSGGKKEGGSKFFINMDEVLYLGSIIMGQLHKGIVKFPEKQQNRSSKKRRSKNRRIAYDQAHLVPGDVFGGYQVELVTPEKIVFKKNGRIVEKLLYDPNKKRITVPTNNKKNKSRRKTTSRRSSGKISSTGNHPNTRRPKKSTRKRTKRTRPKPPPIPPPR
jgi:hypothetical protein